MEEDAGRGGAGLIEGIRCPPRVPFTHRLRAPYRSKAGCYREHERGSVGVGSEEWSWVVERLLSPGLAFLGSISGFALCSPLMAQAVQAGNASVSHTPECKDSCRR